jgi:fibronectin-binding autotransporter adhesin
MIMKKQNKTTSSRSWCISALLVLLIASAPALSAATYTYKDGASPNWSGAANWEGDALPAFDNQTDLVFDSTLGNENMNIGAARTVRSIYFGENLITPSNVIINTVLNDFTGTPALTFQADSGNASVTMANGFQPGFLRLGRNNNGNVVLDSSLDLYINSTSHRLDFDSVVSGAGALNVYGGGRVLLYRANTFSGGVNIYEGRVEAYSSSNALGLGQVVIGSVGGEGDATLSVGNFLTFSNDITVNSGTGSRTISNLSDRPGNQVLSGSMVLNGNVVVDVNEYVLGTHDRINISGLVSGTGGLVKTGAGVLRLTGANNTYSGITEIKGGMLIIEGVNGLGLGAVSIDAGTQLRFDVSSSDASVVGNAISGAGEIRMNNGTVRLVGDVTSTGGLTINGGTLVIGDGTSGTYTGNTALNGGTLGFGRSDDSTYGGNISGGGAMSKTGAGTVNLTGNNSGYSGTITLFSGAILAGNANSLGTGNIRFFTGNGTLRYTAASAVTDWSSRIKNSNGAVRMDTNGNDVVLSGIIDATNTGGLIKLGSGALTLGGANTYTGATVVSNGSLLVNGSTAAGSSVTVENGAILGGSGGINGITTVNSGGIIAPGNSIGQLTVSTLMLESGAVMAFELTDMSIAGTTYDQIVGDSLIFADGGSFTISLTGIGDTISMGDQFTLFDGDVTNFSSANITIINNTSWAGGWQLSEGSLILTAIPEPSAYALIGGLLTLGVVFIRRRLR